VDEPGVHVFAWPFEGARVTVGGVATEAQPYSDDLPLVAVDLAKGTSRIEVRYADSGARVWTATGGALALTVGLLLLLVAFRSHPGDDEIDDEDEA